MLHFQTIMNVEISRYESFKLIKGHNQWMSMMHWLKEVEVQLSQNIHNTGPKSKHKTFVNN